MPAVKHPCLQCKEKHVKCDEERPKCHRCQLKNLSCTRPSKKIIFRHGSAANFSKDQKWVNSEARNFRFHNQDGAHTPVSDPDTPSTQGLSEPWSTVTPTLAAGTISLHDSSSEHASPVSSSLIQSPSIPYGPTVRPPGDHILRDRPLSSSSSRDLDRNDGLIAPSTGISLPPLYQTVSNYFPTTTFQSTASGFAAASPPTHRRQMPSIVSAQNNSHDNRLFPLSDVQEACLLRYYVEEMSHWFDLCDEHRHFQLVVPIQARQHSHLLNAIFAVAARHLSRLPQYKTPQGILYHGQLLPNLTQHDAVEYMLKCIPALREFHDMQDDEYRESIIATAVILRQLEEIDDDDESSEDHNTEDHHIPNDGFASSGKQVNFLPIINAILRSSATQTLFGRRSLIQAAYWMALRQEIYHSFTRMQAPQLIPAPELWQNASDANKAVMHTVQVAKWHWGDGSEQEWLRLSEQQQYLERDILSCFKPILQRPADKTKGEIFPTVWYGSNIEVTSIQQAILAKSVLTAENPFMKAQAASRASWRKVENEVRVLLLELCGMALCHLASPPALVNAAFGIQLYGDFFSDQYERQALRGVVERYRDAHAWPVRRLLEMFRE